MLWQKKFDNLMALISEAWKLELQQKRIFGEIASLTNDILVNSDTPNYAKRDVKTICENAKRSLLTIVETQVKFGGIG